MRSSKAVLFGLAIPLFSARAQEPQMATVLRGVPLSLEECSSRVAGALKSEGYTGLLSFGSGWIAHARKTAVSVGCIAGEHGTVLMLVTAGGQLIVAEAKRLYDRIADTTQHAGQADSLAVPVTRLNAAWNTTAEELAAHVGTRYSFWCPPRGAAYPVFGNEVYASNSSVCTAAVHAGTITLQAGGNAIIEMLPGQPAYPGSARNGVTSLEQGAWKASFVVVGWR